jgi:hypothetical protein
MSTPLPSPDQMNPSSQNNKKQEMEKLQQQFDQATGRVPSKHQPWHTEKGLSKATRDLLDAQEPQQKRSGGFYSETPEQKKQQDQFDAAVRNTPAQGAGTYKLGPVTPEERLRSWHRALGTPSHIVEKEVADLKKQEGKK